MYRWPYREELASGTSPLAITDLGQIETVNNTTQTYPLCETTRNDIYQWYGTLTLSGNPYYWYRTSEAGVPTVTTYPANSDTITVQYWQKTPELVADDDEPLSPSTYHMLIVDLAVQMAYRDSDNHASAEALWGEINRQTLEMIEDLLPQHGPMRQRLLWGSDDS